MQDKVIRFDSDEIAAADIYYPGCVMNLRSQKRGTLIVLDDGNGNATVGLMVGYSESHQSSVWICWARPTDEPSGSMEKPAYLIRGDEFERMCTAFDSMYRPTDRDARLAQVRDTLAEAAEFIRNNSPIHPGAEVAHEIIVAADAVKGIL